MADLLRDFWIRETGTGQQVAQLHDRYMMMTIYIYIYIIVPKIAHRYTEINLYTQWPATCFGQHCGHLQGRKLQRLDTLNVKVKVTLVQALWLCTGRTAHRGSRGIALLFHDQRH